MMIHGELDRLIVQNLADLDATGRRIEEIETRLWSHLGNTAEMFAKRNKWASESEGDSVWIAPRSWQAGERKICFILGWGPNDEGEGAPGEPWFDLSRLVGANGGRLCLWLSNAGFRPTPWKDAMRNQVEAVRDSGFQLTDRTLIPYLDCTPDPESVAIALAEDSLSAAYTKVETAFSTAVQGWKVLDLILRRAGF